MATTTFIPELWSARLLYALDKAHVATHLVNREYQGSNANQGDTVHINSIGAITVKDYTKNAAIADPEALTTTAERLVPDAVARWYGGSEDAFRAAVCAQAKEYRGTEYRWGGKSGRGIDCSGLVSSAYMQCGVLIYRDAKIVEGWPMHEVAFEDKKPGDALFFPGHVALYLGEGRYIHSTGAAVSGGVVINSLEPEDPLYRDDLVKSLYAVGSVF